MIEKTKATINTRVWISEIEFNNSSKIEFSENDITVFVGPNNAGKSASLKEMVQFLRAKNQKGIILKDITIKKTGNETDALNFIDLFSQKKLENSAQLYYRGLGYNFPAQNISHYWSNIENGLGDLFSLFVSVLNTQERLNAANPAGNIPLTTEPPSHPIHFLQKNDGLEKRFSDYFRQAFGTDLIVHRNAGSTVPLYVGEKPIIKKGQDRVSESYLEELEKLPLLHMQGDGMRSFVGVMLNAFISNHSVLFIDEPEAFLHPPQARLLGKMLAKDLPSKRQLFLSTHSEDFLKGLLDANNSNLKIIRIQREENINKTSVLNNSDIRSVWNDPLLRHSNVLSGLFHGKVIICESDADCRFYSAIISAIYEDTDSISPDMLFIHCGGKHRISTIVKSLIKLDVVVKVIADFDVLNNENPLKGIYEELGGIWADVEKDCKIVKISIDQKKPELMKKDLKIEIDSILNSIEGEIVSIEKILKIREALRKASAWAEAKKIGKSYIPSGDATQAYERIQNKFREKGLYIVEVGELESFVKSVGSGENHGPKWVNEVISVKDLKLDPELETARKFIAQVIN